MKRFSRCLLVLAILVILIPISTFAEDGEITGIKVLTPPEI